MQILKFSLGQLKANCYCVIKDSNVLIIDPGDEASFILEEIQRRNLTPVAILATHGHFDHVMAVGEIQASYDIPFYLHASDLFLLKRLQSTVKHFLGYDPVILPIKNIVNVKDELKIKNFKLKIIFTPGHTPGSCSFYLKDENVLFTGDTLFKDGVGSYDHAYSNKTDLFKSIEKLLDLPEETIIYPGHAEETTVLDARF